MNRKNLTAAVLAGLAGVAGIAGTAQAVNVNPDGLGQVLLYPYYTTNDDNITVLSVVNTSEDAKAVKVRFLEGENSREVLDFNMYMSAYDVWTAAIYDDDGTPTMMTTDTTCTVPYIYGNGGVQEFLPWALTDAEYLDFDYTGKKQSKTYGDISRGAEGHFEIIEMGTLVDSTVLNPKWVDKTKYPICDDVLDASGNKVVPQAFPGHPADCSDPLLPRNWTAAELAEPETLVSYGSATAATHKNGVPKNCPQLVGAWTRGATTKTDGYWIKNNFADIEQPSGGLFGGAAIVNVEVGAMYSYDAKAIDGFYVRGEGNYEGDDSHQEPGTILPSLDSGNSRDAAIFYNGDTLESGYYGNYLHRSVDAVSFVLMHDSIMNEYVTDSAIGASTEWVLTFPTKQFYVHRAFLDYYNDKFRGNVAEDFYDTDASGNFIPVPPFTSSWTWTNTTYVKDASGNNTAVVKKPGYVNYPCEIVQLNTIWDREEGTIVPKDAPPGTPVPPIVSPAPPPATGPSPDPVIPFELCYETSVIAFGDGSNYSILGSANTHTIDNTELGFDSGWARLDLWNASWDSDESGVIDKDEINFRDDLGGLVGLPVAGFAVTSFVNAFLGDGANVLANYGGIFTHKGTRKIGSGHND